MEAITAEQSQIHYKVGSQSSDLDCVIEPSKNLSIWKRELPKVIPAVNELMASTFQGVQFVYDRSEPIEVIGSFLDEQMQLETDDALYLFADIMLLTEKMLELCDDQEIGISLERVTNDNCTSFHTDFLGLRLLCTYKGDATYWLENDNVNRDGLGKNNNDLVVKDKNKIQQMQTYWAGIFKGENFEGNTGKGIVHRSPEVLNKKDSTRLLLRIDTIKNFGK
ncbi:MAG: DUF1826 domain-containing protein [Bdellovibrionales bacterium]|nr:DUF1826 domain-containing protein [Bdellovibrionales bacterium]NQZ17929.1 DUF1826 domain-containing protein [Bdellovibrionales bacterium]